MRREVTTSDFVEYRAKTHGCLNLNKIVYDLYDKNTQKILMSGDIVPSEEAKQLVLGTHPSGNWNSSVVGAALDLFDSAVKSHLIKDLSKQDLESVPMQQISPGHPDAQGRRVKAITWEVVAIDDEADIVWVKGVI